MITIKDQDFEMEQIKSTPFFNLKLATIVNAGKEKERIDLKIDGYGMPFEACIKKIVSFKLSHLDITLSTQEYLDLYSKEVIKLLSLVTYTYKDAKKDEDSEEVEEVEDIIEED